jgi:hypothetical protein
VTAATRVFLIQIKSPAPEAPLASEVVEGGIAPWLCHPMSGKLPAFARPQRLSRSCRRSTRR